MNFHTKLVGAFDAIILSSLAAMTVVMLVVLLDPSFSNVSFETLTRHATVTIQQIA